MMRAIVGIIAILLVQSTAAGASTSVRFISVDVYLESIEPLAAWQFEFSAADGGMQIVGVENGDSPAYGDAPYYDREALQQGLTDRIMVADYSLRARSELPSGVFRITTLHLMLTGDAVPEFNTRLVVATTYPGSSTNAKISFKVLSGSEK